MRGYYNQYGDYATREAAFKEKFESIHKGFEYCGSYTGSEGTFDYKCKKCGHISTRRSHCIRGEKANITIRCRNCVKLEKEKELAAKKQIIEERKLKKAREAAQRQAEREKPRTCGECGKTFTQASGRLKYCSDECARRSVNRRKEVARRHKLKENGKIDWDITLDKLIRRDKNICHICGGQCDSKDFDIIDGAFIVGSNYPSIDHVFPVSGGGTHRWGNVKLAHHHCNTVKRDKQLYEAKDGQMALAL
jgi:hypothetical protein